MAKINVTAAPSSGGGGGGGNLQLLSGASMSATLTSVTDTSNTASQLKLSTTSTRVEGTLQIHTDTTTYIDAEDNSGNNRFTISRDPASQLVTVDFASVPTSLTTPVGAIRTATNGSTLVNVLTFLENGNIGAGTDTPGSKLDVHSTGATVAQFNKTVSGNSYIQQLTAGAGKWKHGFTSATGAFDIIDDVNSLTRLSLLNTGQLKLNAYTATSSFPGTTAGFLAFDASGNILSVTAPSGGSPSGVAGSVQFTDGTNFASNAANFFWDNTNVRLGIGFNAPTARLQVRGSGSTSATNALIVQDSAAANLITLRDDGNITLFTASKTGQLDVQGGANSGVYAKAYSSQSDNIIRYKDYNGNQGMTLTMTGSGAAALVVNGTSNNASSVLQADSTTKGFLPPRMTTAQKLAIVTPAAGLQVYDSTLNQMSYYNGTTWINF